MKQLSIVVFVLIAVALSVQGSEGQSDHSRNLLAPLYPAGSSAPYADADASETPGGAGFGFDNGQSGGKSTVKAALLSALVPGGGQYYLGRRQKARYFFAADVLTWVGYFAFHTYGDLRKDDYIGYAAANAGAQLEGKNDDFVDWVGFYDSIDDFNAEGRVGDPDRPYLPDVPEYHWQWSSVDDRLAYRELKNRSRDAYERAKIMLGVAVLSRIVSVADAIRDGLRQKRTIKSTTPESKKNRFDFSLDPFDTDRQVSLTFYPGF